MKITRIELGHFDYGASCQECVATHASHLIEFGKKHSFGVRLCPLCLLRMKNTVNEEIGTFRTKKEKEKK